MIIFLLVVIAIGVLMLSELGQTLMIMVGNLAVYLLIIGGVIFVFFFTMNYINPEKLPLFYWSVGGVVVMLILILISDHYDRTKK